MHCNTLETSRQGSAALFRGTWLGKIVSATMLFFFTFVFYLSPSGSAIANQTNQDEQRLQQLEAFKENTPEKKFAHRLQKLKNKMLVDIPAAQQQRETDATILDEIIAFFSGGETLTAAELDEIALLKQTITDAWAEAGADFHGMAQQLSEKDAPQLAIDRAVQAQQQVDTAYQALLAKIEALLQTPDEANFTDLQQELQKGHFKSRHTAEDPSHLPFGTPKAEVRKPFTETEDLQALLNIHPLAGHQQFAAIGVTQEMLDAAFAKIGGPTPADLAETPDIQLTDAIRAKAEELNHDPIAIYTWVHNSIRYIPSYGSIQGADMTLQTLRGNATDTASLLIALLRASNIPARYAYGTIDVPVDKAINWVGGVAEPFAALNLMGQGGIPSVARSSGGVITTIRQEHTWVEAYVDFEPSRGVKLHNLDSWIPMDASFKQYDFTAGYDLETNVPFDAQPLIDQIEASATINETEGWVQNVPQQAVEDQLTQFQQQLEDYINNQNPDATVGEVLGLKELRIIPPRPLSAGLPYELVVKQQHFSEVPDSLRHKFKYDLQLTNSYGRPVGEVLSFEKNTVDLAGKKLAVSFSPATEDDQAIIESYLPEPDPVTGEIDPNQLPDTLPGYLIHLTAEFSEDGETTTSGAAGTMGGELYETLGLYSPAKGWVISNNYPVAGEYRAIGIDLQGTSAEQALELQQNLETTQTALESEDETQLAALTKHEVVGDLIYGTIFSYFALNNVQDEIAQQSADIVSYRLPSYGMFSTSLETQYWFGVPRNVSFAGLSMDVDYVTHQTVDKQNNNQAWVNYNRSIGSRYSAMEHLVPEQMFSTETAPAEGISAVKALAIAVAEGQRIYTIDSSNVEQALAAINIGAETEQEIRNAAYAGKEITTHQYQINFNGWIGEGYIITDPETGSGAYKIAGGSNGAFLTLAAVALSSILGIVITSTSILVSFPILALLVAVTLIISSAAAIVGPDFNKFESYIDAIEHIALSLIFTNILFLAGILGAATFPIFFIWLAVAFIPIIIKNI